MLIPTETRAEMLAAADAAGSHQLHARVGWIRSVADPASLPFQAASITPGQLVAKIRCTPAPCVEVWAAEDDGAPADWWVQATP